MKMIDDVTKFHETYNVPILDSPQFPSEVRMLLRQDIIEEEIDELYDAMGCLRDEIASVYGLDKDQADIVEVADAIADAIYVLIGTALEFGIPLEKVWNEVHRSNMSKLDDDGNPVYREDGKVLKSNNFSPPDIASIIYEKTGKNGVGQKSDPQ